MDMTTIMAHFRDANEGLDRSYDLLNGTLDMIPEQDAGKVEEIMDEILSIQRMVTSLRDDISAWKDAEYNEAYDQMVDELWKNR